MPCIRNAAASADAEPRQSRNHWQDALHPAATKAI